MVHARKLRLITTIGTIAATGGLAFSLMGLAASASASAAVKAGVSTPVPGVNVLHSVACPTSSACVSVGSDSSLNGKSAIITAATGAAKAWSGALANDSLNAVACAAKATTCLAVADDAVASVKVSGGAMKVTAAPKKPAGGIVALGAIACASARNCYAVGFEGTEASSTAIVVHLSGAGKLLGTTKEPGTGMAAIACPVATRCLVADHASSGESIYLLNNGHLGTSHALPAGAYVQAMSCYQASLCYALGGTGSSAPDELFPVSPATGAIGTKVTIGGSFSGDGLSCVSASRCLIPGFTGTGPSAKTVVLAVNGGKPGPPARYPGESLDSVACATLSRCYAVGLGTNSEAIVDKVSR